MNEAQASFYGGKVTPPTSHKTPVRGRNKADFLPIVPFILSYPPSFLSHTPGWLKTRCHLYRSGSLLVSFQLNILL